MFYEDVEIGGVYKAGLKTVTESEIDLVALLAGCDLPGFLNPEVAKGWGFKDRVAPGPYVLTCMFGLMAGQGFLSNAVWMGAQKVELRAPVYPRDRITAEVEVVDKKPSEKRGGGPVTYNFTVKKEDGTLVMKGVSTCLFTGKPKSE